MRTKQETIKYLRTLSNFFLVEAHRENDDFSRGKAEAYEMAAFEIERNMSNTEERTEG